MRTSRIHHGLALASAATLATISCGALAGAAIAADPKPGHADHGKHAGQAHSQGHGQSAQHQDNGKDQGAQHQNNGHQDNGKATGHANGHASSHGQGQASAQGASHNPPGNNGTVKIAGPGDAVGTPSNNPHPGCTFDIEWFGYDEGQDVVSTVTFTPQAPTSDVTIGGTSPSQVFVGGDPAGGGTDLDGRQAYALTFTGDPHPKQGYHVKVTVATPYSLGNDTKTKVFWVAPCTEESATTTGEDTSTSDQGVLGNHASANHQSNGDRGVEAATAAAPQVAAAAPGTSAAGTSAGGTAVPTAVDAGEDSALPDWARSPWDLAAIAGGLTLAAAAMVRRNRSRA